MTTTRANRCAVPVLLSMFLVSGPSSAENIDPAGDDSQYAYAENVGWINAEPGGDGADGVHVGALDLTGWMWGENTGWVSLSCQNTASCGTVDYTVLNDACGNLSGYAWAENVGWINFAPTTGGVSINPQTGEFSGTAWGENVGWIIFASAGANPYKVTTAWYRPVPTMIPTIRISKTGTDLLITWTGGGDSEGYDVFEGSLTDLRTTGGDFSTSTDSCLAENQLVTSYQQPISVGTNDFFLVRGMNCGGNGTCDSGGAGQAGGRDAGIGSSGTCQ